MWTPETKTRNTLTLWITHECNLNCLFCIDSGNKKKRGFMSMEEIDKSLINAKGQGIDTVLIGGGEPTLHPNVIEIAKKSKSYGFYTAITTNYTNPEIIKKLDGICDTINISYYAENQDNIPNQKDFKSVLYLKVLLFRDRFKTREDFDDFIERYKQLIPNIGFSCMKSSTKWCEENKNIEWLEDLPIEKIVITEQGTPCWIYRGYPINRLDLKCSKKHHMLIDVSGTIYDKNGEFILEKQS